jgi:hypothetical protein
MSDPGAYVKLYQDLPTKTVELVKVVQNMTLHVFWAERYGFKPAPERMRELQLRSMERRLARMQELSDEPMPHPRTLAQKILGNCRDHSLFLVSLLRHRGKPARARCGFGTYFLPDHFEDHWVTEYWDAEGSRWVLVDAQLDALQCDMLKIDFDPLDVPRDRFITAGRAWQMCRSGEQPPEKFGIFDMNGLGFVRGNLVRDLAALNRMELLPWDCWGVILNQLLDQPDDLAVLDAAAELTSGDIPDLDAVRRCYESDARFRMNGVLRSYVNGEFNQETVA